MKGVFGRFEKVSPPITVTDRGAEQDHVVGAVVEPALLSRGAGHDDIAMIGQELRHPQFIPPAVRERPCVIVCVDHDVAAPLQLAEESRLPRA